MVEGDSQLPVVAQKGEEDKKAGGERDFLSSPPSLSLSGHILCREADRKGRAGWRAVDDPGGWGKGGGGGVLHSWSSQNDGVMISEAKYKLQPMSPQCQKECQ